MSKIKSVRFYRGELPGGDWNETVLKEVKFIKDGKELYITVSSLNEFSNIYVSEKPIFAEMVKALKEEDLDKFDTMNEEIKSGCAEYYETEDDDVSDFIQSDYCKEIIKALKTEEIKSPDESKYLTKEMKEKLKGGN